jgi:2-polyprenyl-3-methyl-5-hydroxy-6-metoxy-1,4-benzoquinol methylase
MRLLRSLLEPLPRPVRVLDVGGTTGFWRQMGLAGNGDLEIVVLNLHREPASAANIEAAVGDGRSMPQFDDGAFDVVFSNSVIEHLGTWADQERMATEVRRVGLRFFVQTPNRHFPLEPHFLFPGFQFLPVAARVALVRRLALGYHEALPDPEDARRAVEEIRLLDAQELRQLFPEAELYRERVLGLTKSFVAYGGWSQ